MSSSSGASSYLPLDLLREILPHLSLKSLIRIQAVCRDWKEIVAPYANKFRQADGDDAQGRVTTLMTSTIWLHDEMNPGETVSQTLERFGKDKPELGGDLDANVDKLKELRHDVAVAKIWKADIESLTKDNVGSMIDEMRAILDAMMPTWSDEDKDD